MTLEQLRIFVAVAERQHMTRAAEALNLAQSAASTAIATLEGRHGAKLFHRVGRRIELTEAGGLFLIEAQAVLARAAIAELRLAELVGLKRGTLLIQSSQTIASYWLPRFLVQFRRAYPDIAIKLSTTNTAQTAKAVHDGSAELGFVEGSIDDPALEVTEVARDQLVVVTAPDHPWALRGDVSHEEIAAAEWVMRESGSGTRSVFEAHMAAIGVPISSLKIALELPTNESVRAAVEAGMGATALSASIAAPSLEAELLCLIKISLPSRAFNMIQHAERHQSDAVRALIEMINMEHERTDARGARGLGSEA
jgi:DNA-binding transcriptional LysR family regulator